MRFGLRLVQLLAAVGLAGCQRYEPMPLTATAVDGQLAVAPPEKIQTAADHLRHPLLAPVRIEFQQGLTPEAAGVIAVIVNPTLRAQRSRNSLAAAQLLQAGLLPNPSLDFTLDPVTGGVTQGAVTAYNVGISYEFTALIAHDAKVAAARAEVESVRLDVAWQEWQFAQAARKAAYDLAALQVQRDETAAVDQRLGENLALIQRAVNLRQRTLIDLSAAEAASQKAHADFLIADGELRHQRLVLNQAIGLPANSSLKLAAISLPDRLDLPSEAELNSQSEQRRIDLLALRRGYESQEQALRAAILAQFPRIVLGVHQSSDNTGVISTGLGLTVDLPIFDQNQGTIATARATRQQLFDEYASRIYESRASIAQILQDIGSLQAQILAAEQAIPALDRLVKTYREALNEHAVDVLSYYAAWNDLSQKRIDLAKLQQQLMDDQIGLEIASGRYLPRPVPASGPSTLPASAEAR